MGKFAIRQVARLPQLPQTWATALPSVLLQFLTFSLIACHLLSPSASAAADHWLIDDHSRQSLLTAGQRHLAYLAKQDPNNQQRLGEKVWRNAELTESLQLFLKLITEITGPEELATAIHDHFDLLPATKPRAAHQAGEIFLTGYYEPIFPGSLTATAYYTVPIYRRPDSLVEHQLDGKTQMGRYAADGRFVPYWTRDEIAGSSLLRGFELAYLHDPVDAFFLHIQGSGQIQFADGTTRAIGYAATNGLPYTSIGKVLVDRHQLIRSEVNAPAIRQYLADHPGEVEDILNHNKRFVFFKWQDDSGPRGSLNLLLTPGRSIAIDQDALPVGMPAYLLSRRPIIGSDGKVLSWQPMGRFVLPQDSGAAITGAGRVDLFCGQGREAEALAGYLQEKGQLYFLIKKR